MLLDRNKIVCNNVPVLSCRFGNQLFGSGWIRNQLEIDSSPETFHRLAKNHIIQTFIQGL